MCYTVHWLLGDLKDMTLKCNFYSTLLIPPSGPCNTWCKQPAHSYSVLRWALPTVRTSPRKKCWWCRRWKVNSSLQEEKSEPLPTLQAAPSATAVLASAFLLLLYLKLYNYPYRKSSSAEGHNTFISATVLPPSQGILRHLANMSSCSLWPVLLSQQKPKLCFRQLPAFSVLFEETENIILLNKLFCKCCPANLCGNFTGECFAQHGVHQHSQPHAGLSQRRDAFRLKTGSCSQTWGT